MGEGVGDGRGRVDMWEAIVGEVIVVIVVIVPLVELVLVEV